MIRAIPVKFLAVTENNMYIRISTRHKIILLKPTFFTIGFCLIFSNLLPPNHILIPLRPLTYFTSNSDEALFSLLIMLHLLKIVKELTIILTETNSQFLTSFCAIFHNCLTLFMKSFTLYKCYFCVKLTKGV